MQATSSLPYRISSSSCPPPPADPQNTEPPRTPMLKPQRATAAEAPAGAVVQSMPRAPAILPELSSPAQAAQTSAPTVHPMELHHDRVSSMHVYFLQLQERVHGDFLAHRARLLEGLRRSWRQPPPPSPTLAGEEGWSPSPSEASLGSTPRPPGVRSHTIEVSWNHPRLASHVLPPGA